MKAVGQRDTAPEIRLRRRLWKEGLRYRKHRRIADVRPDLVFLGSRVAVFVDGCFWHGCPDHYVAPAGNAEFWQEKLRRNRTRDQYVTERLERNGWVVFRVWECEVNRRLERVSAKIRQLVKDGRDTEMRGASRA